jgi:hypothetical protein
MLKFYYGLWVDTITKIQSIPKNKDMWEFYSISFISMAMALNLWFVTFLLMLHLNIVIPFLPLRLDIFPGNKLDAFLGFFISYLFPVLLINYLLIFKNRKYLELVKSYKPQNGKLFLKYFIGSLLIIILYFIIGYVVVKLL